jgi:competence protein ComEA
MHVNRRNVKEIIMNRLLLALLLAINPIWLLAGPVDLNTADAETISRELNGIGQARAQAIVDYRNEYGRFKDAEDLLNVSGIGRHILESNRTNIVLDQGR